MITILPRTLFLTALVVGLTPVVSAADTHWVYFGTYTKGASPSKGIYRATFDAASGRLGEAALAAEIDSPSFLSIAPSGTRLYAVGETGKGEGGKGVAAFAVERSSGALTLINAVSAVGEGPCHVNTDASGKMVAIANYGSGSTVSYRVRDDGGLSEAVSFLQHEGSSVNEKRQAGPHAHSVNFSPDNRFAYVCDLGLDKVMIYRVAAEKGELVPNDPAFAMVSPGSGPRHLAFHPNGKFVFVNNELTMTETTFAHDAATGALKEVETVSTLPAEESAGEGLSTAETVVHPSGRFVYVSNRGHDTVAVFACDAATGRLTLVQHAKCEGSIPRNICLDPAGKWMIMAHQKTHDVAVFAVDAATGKLTFTGQKREVGAPVCVRFLAL